MNRRVFLALAAAAPIAAKTEIAAKSAGAMPEIRIDPAQAGTDETSSVLFVMDGTGVWRAVGEVSGVTMRGVTWRAVGEAPNQRLYPDARK